MRIPCCSPYRSSMTRISHRRSTPCEPRWLFGLFRNSESEVSLAIASGKSCELSPSNDQYSANVWTDCTQYLKINGGYTFAGSYVEGLLTRPTLINIPCFPRNSCIDIQSVPPLLVVQSMVPHADGSFSSLTGWIPELVSFQRFGSTHRFPGKR